jgi:hypothetical protein
MLVLNCNTIAELMLDSVLMTGKIPERKEIVEG